jgi:tetratricopeptide (TPR) repeat protein
VKSYVDQRERHTVLGEGYYTAAAYLDWMQSQQMTTATSLGFLEKILPSTAHPDLVLASLYLEIDRCDEAVSLLKRSSLRKQRDLNYISTRAVAADRAGEYRAALWWFSLQERTDTPSVTLSNNMGDCLIYLGQSATVERKRQMYFSRALEVFNRAPGTSPSLHFNKGRLLALMRNYDHAMLELRNAIAAGPQFPLPHILLADVLADIGELGNSVHHYREGLSLRPRHLHFLIRASDVALRGGMLRQAWEFLSAYESKQAYMSLAARRKILKRKNNLKGRIRQGARDDARWSFES